MGILCRQKNRLSDKESDPIILLDKYSNFNEF